MAKKKEDVPVRVLVDCIYGECNTYAEVPADQIEVAKANGLVDDHPSAVEAVRPQ